MAMNKARRTANLNNILTYDTLGNSTLIANLTVEGLTGAGFVKADAAGLLSVDTAAYTVVTGATNYLTKITAPNTLGQSLVYDNGTSVLVNTAVGVPGYSHAFQVMANGAGGLVVSTTDVASAIGIVNSSSANKTWDISPYGNHLVINESGVATRMKFDAGGNITIGDITNTGHKLEVVGSFRTTGTNTLSALQGVGDRMVVANTNGVLTTQPIPTGSITGTGAAGQVNFWTGTTTVSGSNNLFWDNANGRLGIGTNVPAVTLDIFGNTNFKSANANNATLSVTTNTLGATLSVTGGSLNTRLLYLSPASGETRLFTSGANSKLASYDGAGSVIYELNTSGQSYFLNNVHIGGSTNPAVKFQVTGDTLLRGSGATSATTALTVQNSSSVNLLRVLNDGQINLGSSASFPFIRTVASDSTQTPTGTKVLFGTQDTTTGNGSFLFGSNTLVHTTGTVTYVQLLRDFVATSGTGSTTHLLLNGGINQTGGANGITRGIYIVPTLTAAADWRSIEWSNNSGWGLYGAGTAPNYLAGNLLIGSTNNFAKLYVGGVTSTATTQAFVGSQPSINGALSNLYAYWSNIVGGAAVNITNAYNFFATQSSMGSSTITNLFGFAVESTLTVGTNNYGFYGNIASGTGRWNLYMNGTADNLLNGRLYIPAGSYDLPSLSFVNDTNTGLFSPLADNIELKTGTNNAVVLENQGTNIMQYSENLGTFPTNFQQVSVSIPGNVAAPDGTLTANIAVPDTSLNQHRFFRIYTVSNPNTISVYAKAAGYNFISFGSGGGVSGDTIIFDIVNGTISGTASNHTATIENVGNGWFRCSLTITSVAAPTSLSRFIIVRNSNSTANYSGDGTSGVYVWGWQIEENTASTSYTKTDATAVIRPQAISLLGQNLYGNLITRRVTGPSLTDLSFATGFTDRMTIHRTSGNVMINSSNDLGQRLQVMGDVFIRGTGNTNATNALAVQNSDSLNLFRQQNNGTILLGSSANAPRIFSSNASGLLDINGDGLTFSNPSIYNSPSSGSFNFTGDTFVSTSGFNSVVSIYRQFLPSSGNAGVFYLNIVPTVNQSAGGTGRTVGIRISPNLTSPADWRSIDIENSVGWGIYGSGTANNYLAGSLGIGNTSLTGINLRVSKNITGATTALGIWVDGRIQNDVTANAILVNSSANSNVTGFNTTNVYHFLADRGTYSSTVTNAYGYFADGTITYATNNYGFYGNISSGTGRWNLFMNSNADNYLAGRLGLGSTALTFANFRVSSAVTGNVNSTSIFTDSVIQSDVTSSGTGYYSGLQTAAASFTLANLRHFIAEAGTFGAGSVVTTQSGFTASSNLTGATNNYGFRGSIAAATGRWNIYMDGTANNYMAGDLAIGGTTIDANTAIQVNSIKGIRINGAGGGFGYSILRGTETSGLVNNGSATLLTSTNQILFQTATLTRLTIDANGVVSINTNGQSRIISSRVGANSNGNNTFIGDGGNSAVGSVGNTLLGSGNVSVGTLNQTNVSTGYYNASVGYGALGSITTGLGNTAIGTMSLFGITAGDSNTSLGYNAGRYFGTGGTNLNASATGSVYLGSETRASASGNSNEIIIGTSTTGNGSNTVTLGNTSITATYLRGNVTTNGSVVAGGSVRSEVTQAAVTNNVSVALLGSNITTYAAGFSMANAGYGLNAVYAQHEQRFGGNATFAHGNLNGGGLILNRLAPTAAGTVTITQQTGQLRTMSNLHLMTQFDGNNNLTVTDMSGLHIYGHYRTSGTGTLTVSNAYYGIFLADPNEFGTGATISGTNWGIYQQGAAPNNHFGGKVLIGTTTIGTSPLRISGLPTSAAGLGAGEIWNNGGVLTVV